MAGDPSGLLYADEEGVPVAVGLDGFDLLDVAGLLALLPHLLPAPGPEVGVARLLHELHGLLVGPGDHEHLVGDVVLDHDGDQSFVI